MIHRTSFIQSILLSVLMVSAWAQNSIRVLMLGGADNAPAHFPLAMKDTLAPFLTANNMTLAYRDTQTVLNADSLKAYDVVLLAPADHGSGTAGGSNLTTAQEDALIGWISAGHVAVALHGATNTYLNNPRWLKLLGAEFLDHGSVDNAGTVTLTKPTHPALTGITTLPASAAATGGQPYWDEGRRHKNFSSDTVVLATARLGGGEVVPWIWVRPEGSGWVYYNASGHDGQCWKLSQWKGQILQAIRWGDGATVSINRFGRAVNHSANFKRGEFFINPQGQKIPQAISLNGRSLKFGSYSRPGFLIVPEFLDGNSDSRP